MPPASKAPIYVIYKDCPGKPLKPVKKVRGHVQAFNGLKILDDALSPEDKTDGCHHWLKEDE